MKKEMARIDTAQQNEIGKLLKTNAGNAMLIEQLSLDMQKLNGTFETLKHSLSPKKEAASGEPFAKSEELQNLQTQLTAINSQLTEIRGVQQAHETKLSEIIEAKENAQKLTGFENGMLLFNKGEYLAAIESFRSVVLLDKKDTKRDEALFWIGESYFKLGEFEQAIATFQTLVEKFPDSDKLCLALYRQGNCFRRLKKKKEARLFLTDASKRCEKESDVITKIKKELKELD